MVGGLGVGGVELLGGLLEEEETVGADVELLRLAVEEDERVVEQGDGGGARVLALREPRAHLSTAVNIRRGQEAAGEERQR
jgi:hypothetical protein